MGKAMTKEPTPLPPLVHHVNAAAARIGVSRRKFYELVACGCVRTLKIGGRTVVAEAELQRVVAEAAKEAA